MSKLFKKYPEEILIALAIAFSVLALGYFILGVTSATRGIADVFNIDISKGGAGSLGFNISAAAKLDLRGLEQ